MHYQLKFENTSASTCSLYGFPGVSFLGSSGQKIGPPAGEGTATPRRLVTISPQGVAYAALDVTDPSIPPCAGGITAATIHIYPPASKAAIDVTAQAAMQVCSSANSANYVGTTVGPVSATSRAGYNP